jgi:hypothetical protein
MTGEISEVNIKGDNKSSKVKLTVVDKTYVILNRLYTFAYTSAANKNAPEIIQDVVRFVTDDVDSDPLSYDASGNHVANGIYAVDARLVSEGTSDNPGYIEDTRRDGSVFPDLAMAKVAKSAYEWVENLSTIESTNDFTGDDDDDAPTQDRNMLFYIDERNKLHWYYPRDSLSTTLNGAIDSSQTTVILTDATNFPIVGTIFIGDERIDYTGKTSNTLTGCVRGANNTTAASHSNGDSVRNAIVVTAGDTSSEYTVLNYSLTKKTFDVVNFVIFSCGADMFGNGITSYYFEKATSSKSLKDVNKAYNDIASKLLQEEINAGRLTEDNNANTGTGAFDGAFTFKGNRYSEATGDYDSGGGITTAWGDTVTTNAGYNTSFRTECIRQGKIRAKALTSKRGSPRWKGSIEFKFRKFTPGELFEFTSTRAGLNQQALRINVVQYNFTKTGAFCTVQVEEDEVKLV